MTERLKGSIFDDSIARKTCVCKACGDSHTRVVAACEARCMSEGSEQRCSKAAGHKGPHFRMMGMTTFVEWPNKSEVVKAK